MLHSKLLLTLGSVWAFAFLIHLTGGAAREDGFLGGMAEEHHSWNVVLTAEKRASPVRKFQCRGAPKAPHRRPSSHLRHLLEDVTTPSNDDGTSADETCFTKDSDEWERDSNEFDPNPPTMDPNLLPPSAPTIKIKSNSTILVSWHAVKREKYPIDYYMVEFYQYEGIRFRSKCCTWVNNTIKNKSDETYHEELIDALEPEYDYKFRIYTVYWNEEMIPGQFCEPIKLVYHS